MLFSDSVEALKNQYTDKYVRVNAARPELARFHDAVGQVKTVNMSGRALVEFMDYHLNIGWFDIDPSCLTVVDKPAPKDPAEKAAKPPAAVAKPAAAKPAAAKAAPAAGEKKLSPLELARMQGAGGKAAAAPVGILSGECCSVSHSIGPFTFVRSKRAIFRPVVLSGNPSRSPTRTQATVESCAHRMRPPRYAAG